MKGFVLCTFLLVWSSATAEEDRNETKKTKQEGNLKRKSANYVGTDMFELSSAEDPNTTISFGMLSIQELNADNATIDKEGHGCNFKNTKITCKVDGDTTDYIYGLDDDGNSTVAEATLSNLTCSLSACNVNPDAVLIVKDFIFHTRSTICQPNCEAENQKTYRSPVFPGTTKWDIEIHNWQFCDGEENCDGEVAKRLKIGFATQGKRNNKVCKAEKKKKQPYKPPEDNKCTEMKKKEEERKKKLREKIDEKINGNDVEKQDGKKDFNSNETDESKQGKDEREKQSPSRQKRLGNYDHREPRSEQDQKGSRQRDTIDRKDQEESKEIDRNERKEQEGSDERKPTKEELEESKKIDPNEQKEQKGNDERKPTKEELEENKKIDPNEQKEQKGNDERKPTKEELEGNDERKPTKEELEEKKDGGRDSDSTNDKKKPPKPKPKAIWRIPARCSTARSTSFGDKPDDQDSISMGSCGGNEKDENAKPMPVLRLFCGGTLDDVFADDTLGFSCPNIETMKYKNKKGLDETQDIVAISVPRFRKYFSYDPTIDMSSTGGSGEPEIDADGNEGDPDDTSRDGGDRDGETENGGGSDSGNDGDSDSENNGGSDSGNDGGSNSEKDGGSDSDNDGGNKDSPDNTADKNDPSSDDYKQNDNSGNDAQALRRTSTNLFVLFTVLLHLLQLVQ